MPQDFDLSQFKSTYFEECQDLLSEAEENLNVLQKELANVDVEVLHAIFRSVHSIKGGAGAFNFVDLVEFSHIFETLLDKLREGEIQVSEKLSQALFSAIDILSTLVQMAQDEEDVDKNTWKPVANTLQTFLQGSSSTPQDEEPTDNTAEEDEQGWGLFVSEDDLTPPVSMFPSSEETKAQSGYKISFVPEKHLLRFANEPLLIARELATLGECSAKVDLSRLTSLNDLVADEAYLSWEFELVSDCSVTEVEEAFEFVVDDCALEIEAKEFAIEVPTETVQNVEEPVRKSAVARQSQRDMDRRQPVQSMTSPAVVDDQASAPVEERQPKPSNKGEKNDQPETPTASKVSSIRVDLDRVDKLVNMVGELVITQAMLKQQSEDLPDNMGHVMARGFEVLSSHTRDLQESVMAIRMQPVKSVFARMPRLVRELSTKLEKQVDLVTSGEMTEVDKTVIEQLMDPLTHMIRNSLDHGIELPGERLALGKSEKATVFLSAEHRSGRIQIEISDDGRGIDRERVANKAKEKGIIGPDDELSDEEIDNLIFAPGFSTADTVSDVSGRGVGMDVVRRNILSLGGRISVFSEPGQGARFLLSLPLTLAVLDGMIVKCGNEKYIIPLTSVIESIHPMREELKAMVNGGHLVSVRGEYIRIVNLHHLFNITGAVTNPEEGLIVIVETERFGLVGILVDELLGQQQVVIKSLEENYDPIPGVSAATILGNGKVALILDVDGLADMEHEDEGQRRLNGYNGKIQKAEELKYGN